MMTLSIFTEQFGWQFLWLLGAFFIGWFYWRWWYLNKCDKEISEWKTKCLELENSQNTTIKAKKVLAPGVSTAAATKFVDGVARVDDSVRDDLTKIEGIGPKIMELLNSDSIWSYKQLSEVSVSGLDKILKDAGPRYKIHSPKTWPKQAKMALEGKWDELKKWQSSHKGGRVNKK